MTEEDKIIKKIIEYYETACKYDPSIIQRQAKLVYKDELINLIEEINRKFNITIIDTPSILKPKKGELKKFESKKYSFSEFTVDFHEKIVNGDDSYLELIEDCKKSFLHKINEKKDIIDYYKKLGKNLYIYNIFIYETFDADKDWITYNLSLHLNGIFDDE